MMLQDRAAREEQIEAARVHFGRLVILFERDFGINSYINRAPELKYPEQLRGAELLVNRYKLLSLLPRGGRVIEVGVDQGNFSRRILNESEPESLTLIDIDLSRMTKENRLVLEQRHEVEITEGDSATILSSLPKDSFDWIYIDAHHGYDYVKRDIDASHDKVRPGGFIVFNDYTMWSPANMMNYGVSRAVNEFLNSHEDWRVRYFALQGAGYYDFVIQRPEY